ncbi:MAG: hypothetical protein IKV05_02135 [Bacteroidales bacterium]|nr:hypothetical protein [Bacteroidales bacterium]
MITMVKGITPENVSVVPDPTPDAALRTSLSGMYLTKDPVRNYPSLPDIIPTEK